MFIQLITINIFYNNIKIIKSINIINIDVTR